ncbi:MAG: hypothetical protein NTY19_06565 [Planctomycetota bacterium]|nr:hypothetical protein [Planctomycetota bacterium]
MAPVFYWPMVVLILTTAARAEEILLDNQSEHPFRYQIRHATFDNWGQSLALAQGKQHRFRTSVELVIRFRTGKDWASYRLATGKWFRYGTTPNGKPQFQEVGNGLGLRNSQAGRI